MVRPRPSPAKRTENTSPYRSRHASMKPRGRMIQSSVCRVAGSGGPGGSVIAAGSADGAELAAILDQLVDVAVGGTEELPRVAPSAMHLPDDLDPGAPHLLSCRLDVADQKPRDRSGREVTLLRVV